jgi:anti-sigma regulatory factor (Ser/Thr protein kinase)
MQRTLLPMALPQVPGLRFSAKYLPAGSGVKIGGDWYDAFQMPDGRVAFVIGDVTGRGVLAASVMAELRTALRAFAMEGHDVAVVMSHLNELVSSMGRNRSATAALFALDVETERVAMVSAGHPPALLLEPDHEPRFVAHASGPPLGSVPAFAYESEHLSLPPGSTLVLYTDGLIERREESIDEGLRRVSEAAAAATGDPQMTVADGIFQRLVGDSALDDDLALLAIEALPHSDQMKLTFEATPRVLAGMRRAIARWLINIGVPEHERFDIVLAVSEAAGNAVEHAYGPHDATFTLDCSWADGEVRVRVADTGTWRAQRRSERGRGLMLMREFMDSVDVQRGELGTIISLVKRVEK